MPRYKLTLEYDGTGLVGWQRQANGVSVQQLLEEAVEGFCGKRITVHGAGRTDAGVHALAQTAHLDLSREASPEVIRNALNHHLKPAAVAVLAVERVADSFDARRSAKGRVYLYRILNRRPPPVLERSRVWHVGPLLDAEAMQEAATLLLGKHDFTSFRDSLCQAKSPVKTLDVLRVTRAGEEIHVEARARSFLHHQVRTWSARSSWWAPANGAPATSRARSKRATAAPAARPRRPRGFTWWRWCTGRGRACFVQQDSQQSKYFSASPLEGRAIACQKPLSRHGRACLPSPKRSRFGFAQAGPGHHPCGSASALTAPPQREPMPRRRRTSDSRPSAGARAAYI